MFLPERLRQCREELGISQETMLFDLDKAGLRLSRQILSYWENGKSVPDANEVAILARFFKKSIGYFFAPII